ncbi:uncharacterized protein [Medicago truncatula]|uniref:uncharacterized protein isoform X2 n=1 Tax=Medicago truncatula TaxID=3880 RepID=UPI000D2F27C3|nr:uncharacterized protein LOC112422707 isoform X2 [Medicago truncatula]
MAGRGRGGGTRLARVDVAGGSTSQTGPSQTVNPTQYQHDYQVYEHVQDQAYHFQEPQPHQYQFDAYQQHQNEDHHEQPGIEQEQPDIEEPQQQDDIEQPQQHDSGGRFQGVYEVGPDGYAGEPSELTLLPHFGGHLACRVWVDANFRRKHRVKGISHGKKLSIKNLTLPMPGEQNEWFWLEVNMSGLTPFLISGYENISHGFVCAMTER